jgi:hypothetical protein
MSSAKLARNPIESDRGELRYIWDEENPEGYANRIGRYRTDVESRFLFDHLGPSPLRILDMGGGSGRFGGALSDRGHDVTLIDKNPEAVALPGDAVFSARLCATSRITTNADSMASSAWRSSSILRTATQSFQSSRVPGSRRHVYFLLHEFPKLAASIAES